MDINDKEIVRNSIIQYATSRQNKQDNYDFAHRKEKMR